MSQVKRKTKSNVWYLPPLFRGLLFTLNKMLSNLSKKNKMLTLNYPEEHYNYGPRFKGEHVLTVKKDGSLRCTACMLCATNCPANCITIVASDHQSPEVEKYPISYEIDILRCVFCGFCEEACPVDAIRMGPEWQTANINGSSFNYDIKYLSKRKTLNGGILSCVDDKKRHDAGI